MCLIKLPKRSIHHLIDTKKNGGIRTFMAEGPGTFRTLVRFLSRLGRFVLRIVVEVLVAFQQLFLSTTTQFSWAWVFFLFINLIVTEKIDRTNHTRTASDRCVSKGAIPGDAPISMRTDKGRICSIFHPRATCCVTATENQTGFRSGRLIGLVTLTL